MSDIHTPPPPDEALDRLYRAHSSSIYRYALALVGNHVDAEDLSRRLTGPSASGLKSQTPRGRNAWAPAVSFATPVERGRGARGGASDTAAGCA